MRYLIVQDWPISHGNHAGMVWMCKRLSELFPNDYRVFVKEAPQEIKPRTGLGGLVDKVCFKLHISNDGNPRIHYRDKVYPREYMELCRPMFEKLRSGDSVFLLEYMEFETPQYQLACFIRKHYPGVRIYGMVHFTVDILQSYRAYNPNLLEQWARPVDRILTLGSSLTHYLVDCGLNEAMISTGFHYVDSDYYHKSLPMENGSPLTVITMGAMRRNYRLLAEVVSRCPEVHWVICRGRKSEVDSLFSKCGNVDMKGYLAEDELRHQMDLADISISVMEDTIGSNVITTSMAMGLAMLVSDVGSIRDYCDDSNAVFCENTATSFADAVHALSANPQRVLSMRRASVRLSEKLRVPAIHQWFSSLS